MKSIPIILLTCSVAVGQTVTASIAGTVVDSKTSKPVPAALVIANRAGAPPLARNTKTGGDGTFLIQRLAAGNYLLCVQVAGDRYLNPCQWNGAPAAVTIAAAQAATGIKIALIPASVLNIQVNDAQKVLSQLTKDGRHPDLTLGVWGPKGMYYPARAAGSGPTATAGPQASANTYSYRLAVPRDTALNFYIASHDLKLGDANGVALPSNASQQAFQHTTGDNNPKSFTFSVMGFLP